MQINGLTREQVNMLDIMWKMQDLDEVERWQKTLHPKQRKASEALKMLLIAMVIDEEEDPDTTEAEELIARIKTK